MVSYIEKGKLSKAYKLTEPALTLIKVYIAFTGHAMHYLKGTFTQSSWSNYVFFSTSTITTKLKSDQPYNMREFKIPYSWMI
jgi:hypothetical protein